jgi:hypothetical protein
LGLYKICGHRGRARDRCQHAWWGSFQYKGTLHRCSLARWANEEIQTKQHADAVYERMRADVRAGRFNPIGNIPEQGPLTFERFADVYIEKYVRAKALASADTIEYRMAPV